MPGPEFLGWFVPFSISDWCLLLKRTTKEKAQEGRVEDAGKQ